MVGLTISMHFQQFEELKFLIYSGGACPRPDLGEIVPILLENPESRLDFSRNTSIPILKISSYKPTSREVYFC